MRLRKRIILRLLVLCSILINNASYAKDDVADKILFSALELKVKYYNAINLYELCSRHDEKYESLLKKSFSLWRKNNQPLFERVLTILPEKDDYFNDPVAHKNTLLKQFSNMSNTEKHTICSNLNKEYESTTMDFSKSHKIVFVYINARQEHENEN